MDTAAITALKKAACDTVDRLADELIEISHSIHDHPELNFAEHHAHDLLTDAIARQGHSVERNAFDLDTAFSASIGAEGRPSVGVFCEYDALPEVGHACGHNVIAAAGLGAGLAAGLVANQAGGRLVLLGSPAEEGGGGKILMARRGALDGLDAAMMVHPGDADLIRMDAIAIHAMTVRYEGLAAHAAAAPWAGRNALDAAVLGYQGVAALRQHIQPSERIHGIFTKGGTKANIVPHEAEMVWFVRSPTTTGLEPLKERVIACIEAGATAAGCSCHLEWDDVPYFDMIDNGPLVASYVANAAALGRRVDDPKAVGRAVVGSTDMGNVSYMVPSIHPMIKVAGDGVAIHTLDFAWWARSEGGDQAVLDGAKAMAMTAIDYWTDAAMRASVSSAFASR